MEQLSERPSRKQRRCYSGKKNRHNTGIAVMEQGSIVDISKLLTGRLHEFKIRRRAPPLLKHSYVYAE